MPAIPIRSVMVMLLEDWRGAHVQLLAPHPLVWT
jgi:hypothetical protein